MRDLLRWKYMGAGIGIGLSILLLGGGVYANTKQSDKRFVSAQEENNSVSFADLIKTDESEGAEPESESLDNETVRNSDEVKLSAGTELVFEETMSEAADLQADIAMARSIAAEEAQEPAALSMEPETYWGYTNLGIAHVDNHLNIREEPSESGKLVGKLSKDAACEILGVENGWAHIKSGKVEGYCSTDFLYMGEEAITRGQEVASMIAVVNTQTLKVREEPNTESVVITLIPQEEELEVDRKSVV